MSDLITAVFESWKRSGIDFLVLRNHETLPHFTTNDIDVLVAPAQRDRAEQTLIAAAADAGWRLHNRAEFATLSLHLCRTDTNGQAHFDLFTDLRWRSFEFLRCRDFLRQKIARGLFAVPHPAHEACTNLLASLIFSGRVKDKYKPAIAAAFRADRDAASDLLAETYGRRLADSLVETALQEHWAAIEANVGRLRRKLVVRQAVLSPGRSLKSLASDLVRLSRRWLRPPGLTLVLLGADGSGKSTVARLISDGLTNTFSPQKSRHFHWKPRIFFSGRAQAHPTTDPHGRPPRNRVLALCYFGYHWLEFFLGAPLKIRPVLFKGGLALIERYFCDFFVDQTRYRLNVPPALVRLGYQLVKKPDLVILLDATPEVLRARKQEVSLPETIRQRDAYRKFVAGLGNGVMVDASQPPDKVAADAIRAVLEFMVERTRHRTPSWRGRNGPVAF